MKVWHIIDSGGLYGAEVMLINLILEQKKQNIEPIIISIGNKGIGEKALEREAVSRKLEVKKYRMRSGPNFIGAYGIIKDASLEGINLLHCHGYKANILLGFMPKWIRKIPIVSTLHGWIEDKKYSRMNMYILLDAISLRFFNHVVVVNKSMLENRHLKGDKKINISVINNGIEKERHHRNDLDEIDQYFNAIVNSSLIVGAIGRLSKEKGYEDLVSAVSLLRKDGLDVHLVILGEGPEYNNLMKLAKDLDIQDFVYLPGYIKDPSVYLEKFSVMVLPSLTEGLPITLLEAMRERIPVVATNIGGMPDTLENGKGGVIVAVHHPKEVAEAIKTILMKSDSTNRMIEYSYRNFCDNYTSQVMAKKYFDVYMQVIEES